MGDNYKEVCWYDKILKETSQLLPCLSDDTWEQSQDTTNTELSRDSVEVDLKPHNVSSTESQDSLLIAANTVPALTDEYINSCVSPFYGHMENTEESFNLLGESPKRRSGDTSIENSPKRMNLGNKCDAELPCSASLIKVNTECVMLSLEEKVHIVTTESTENNSEECQVVPTTAVTSEAVASDNNLESHKLPENCEKRNKRDDTAVTAVTDAVESDKTIPKPRQASVDSVLDSGLGDSCNSVDSTEEKYGIGELKSRRLERHCWQSKIRESLATRLPGIVQYFRARLFIRIL